MKQRPDPSEVRGSGGLFDPVRVGPPPVSRLFSPDDPETSRKAAVKVLTSGTVEGDAVYLCSLVVAYPGNTLEFYGEVAAAERGNGPVPGEAFRWRLKLGRRTGTLQKRGLIHAKGERDGCSLWWPGRAA